MVHIGHNEKCFICLKTIEGHVVQLSCPHVLHFDCVRHLLPNECDSNNQNSISVADPNADVLNSPESNPTHHRCPQCGTAINKDLKFWEDYVNTKKRKKPDGMSEQEYQKRRRKNKKRMERRLRKEAREGNHGRNEVKYERSPEADLSAFQLESLSGVERDLHQKSIPFAVIEPGHDTCAAITALAKGAVLGVTDTWYLRRGRADREAVASSLSIPLYAIETDVVVTVQVASNKAQFAARTIRPVITRALTDYLVPTSEIELT
ncbi:deoxyribodipyrimidine photo-lyase [Gracilaria domingensis]|nr:deoxyribodipyrimidine photo-lyase [Gracilaria domingensis]